MSCVMIVVFSAASTLRCCFCVLENDSGYFHQLLNDAYSCLYWVCFGRAVRSLTRSCPCLCQRVREYRLLSADTNMSLIKNSHISLQNQNNILIKSNFIIHIIFTKMKRILPKKSQCKNKIYYVFCLYITFHFFIPW